MDRFANVSGPLRIGVSFLSCDLQICDLRVIAKESFHISTQFSRAAAKFLDL